MKCTIVGQRLRIMSKAVRLLSKYSESVVILAKNNGLIFQAVNDSESAFVEVIFRKEFFAAYDLQDGFDSTVDIKSLVLVFKIINLDRMVETCKITMDSSLPKIVFEMRCKYGAFRDYYIPFMEGEAIKCTKISERINTPLIKSPAKVFSEIFKHFTNSTKDATVWFYDNHMRFKSYIDVDDQNFFDLPCTSFCYTSREFVLYNYTKDLTVTFNVRDIKAFIDFATHQNQLVNAYFLTPSRPIEFVFQSNADYYSARIIMATVEHIDAELPTPPSFSGTVRTNNRTVDRSQNTNNSINESLVYSMTDTTASNLEQPETNDDFNMENDNNMNLTCSNAQGNSISVSNETSNNMETEKSINLSSPLCSNNNVNSYNEDDQNISLGGDPVDIPPVTSQQDKLSQQNMPSFHQEPSQRHDQTCSSSVSNNNFIKAISSFDIHHKNAIVMSSQSFSSSSNMDDDNLNDEIGNIVTILDNLPDFLENDKSNDDCLMMSGSQLRNYQRNFFEIETDEPNEDIEHEIVVEDSD